MKIICAWCKCDLGEKYPDQPGVSHGICEACAKRVKEERVSNPIIKNLDLYKTSAKAYEHFAGLDLPTEEEEARAAEEVERQIDQWVEEHGEQI